MRDIPMPEMPNAGETIEVPQILKMPVKDVDFGTITITENWGRLFIRHQDKEIIVERGAYVALIEAISKFVPQSEVQSDA